jgi:hypothetical protein
MTKLSQTMTSFEAMAPSASSVIQDHQNIIYQLNHNNPQQLPVELCNVAS